MDLPRMRLTLAFTIALALSAAHLSVRAEELLVTESEEAPPAAPPPPMFGGPFCERIKLTGDWHGVRNCLLENGMTWDIDHTDFYFGVASGGREQRSTFAGHGDYVMN